MGWMVNRYEDSCVWPTNGGQFVYQVGLEVYVKYSGIYSRYNYLFTIYIYNNNYNNNNNNIYIYIYMYYS